VIRSGNLRSGPAKTADAVATLNKGTRVTVVDHHGNWVHVRAAAQDASHKALDGWMFSTFLSDAAGTATREMAPAKHTPAQHAPAEHPSAEQAPADQAPGPPEQAPAEQAPAEQAPPKSP
jgi:hypothetical protein